MYKHQRRLASLSIMAVLVFIACGVSSVQQSGLPIPPETLAAQTWSAMQMVAALSATPTYTPQPITDTPVPTNTPTNTNTPTVTNTPIPPLTERPTNTPQPTATATKPVPTVTKIPYYPGGGGTGGGGGGTGGGGGAPAACLAAKLIRHVTIPNGAFLPRNQAFVKVWRIQNVGSCTWNSSVTLTPYGYYDPFFGVPVYLYQNVKPGKVIDIPVNLITPNSDGNYTGLWVLQADGESFADTNGQPFRVNVNVSDSPPNPIFDFTVRACEGVWQSNARIVRNHVSTSSTAYGLRCPARSKSPVGFVVTQNNPNTEAGVISGMPGLWTNPPFVNEGVIQGYFPALLIHTGDTFSAQVGCLNGNGSCNVTFELKYQVIVPPNVVTSENSIGMLEVYEGSLSTYSVDLGALGLTGQYVSFALRVRAHNDSEQNAAIWIAPRIIR